MKNFSVTVGVFFGSRSLSAVCGRRRLTVWRENPPSTGSAARAHPASQDTTLANLRVTDILDMLRGAAAKMGLRATP